MTTQWVIDAVQLGELRDIPAEEIYFKDRTRRSLSMPLVMFVLRSNGRTVVVDTGGPADEEQVRCNIPFDYVAAEVEQAEGALARLGVGPDDVDIVVNTHLHWDHCSNNELSLPSRRFTDLPAFYTSLARLKGTGWTPLPSHDHTVVEKGAFGY